MNFDKKMKKLKTHDIALVKLSTAAFVLFVITVWPAAMDLVHSIHWGWFLAAFVIFAISPTVKFYG
jgi:hypothetical protein